jgi:hypothetical protein
MAGRAVLHRAGAAGRTAYLPGGARCPRRRAGGAGKPAARLLGQRGPAGIDGVAAGLLPRIAELTGLTLAAEVAEFRRSPSAPAFMGFTGLTPSEYSSAAHSLGRHHQDRPAADPQHADRGGLGLPAPARDRGHTQAPAGPVPGADAGPLVEGAAAAARHLRQADPEREDPPVAVTAVARELAGLVWAYHSGADRVQRQENA